MSERAAKRLATGLWLLGFALGTAAFALMLTTLGERVPVYAVRGGTLVMATAFSTVGALVGARRPTNAIGWLLLASGIGMATVGFCGEYAIFSVSRHGGRLPLTLALAWLQTGSWVLCVALVAPFSLMLFPDGRLPSSRWRVAFWVGLAGTALFFTGFSVFPGELDNVPVSLQNPLGISETAAESILYSGSLLFMASIVLAIASLVVRYRRSRGDVREQIKWVAYLGSLVLFAILLNSFMPGPAPEWLAKAAEILMFVSLTAIPVGAGIAILKYRLYDIDLVINRTIVLAGLVAFITLVYVGVVAGIGAAVGARGKPNLGLSILATAIVAVAIQPIRGRANRVANRLVYGKRAAPAEVLSEFAGRIAGAYSTTDVLPRLARLMTEATAARSASVWLALGPELRRVAAWPTDERPPAASLRLAGDDPPPIPGADRMHPVRHSGELLGVLAVAAAPEEPLSPADETLLADLASHAGLLLGNVRLIAELQASRQRLVAAQDAERRRIERNLHDGAQQQLVALAVKLGLAKGMLPGDPASAGELVDEAKMELSDALETLRVLARGIYPPLLADRGLAAALESQTQRAALPVAFDADGVGRYPIEVESAVYFCVLEALQNVAKYAGASAASVGLRSADDGLSFTVVDDGTGFDVRATPRGAGLTNMTDRLEAIGGRIEVRSQPGAGTTVAGWVPARPAP